MSIKHEKQSVALSSVFASAFLTFSKLIVGILTGSIGILSEAAHSALDFGAALLTFFAVRVGDQPADRQHPYGHTKVESVSALIETGLLFLTSAWIIYEAVRRLLVKEVEVKVTWYAIAIIIVSILVDFSRSRALNRVAKATNSQALEADALHFSSDIYSSFIVLFGLIFVALGINKADAIAAVGVSLFVLYAGFNLGKRTIDVLIDAAPEGLTEKITEITKKVKGVIDIEKLRIRPAGAVVFVDMVITVSRKLPLEKAQDLIKTIEKEIRKSIPETDIIIHTKPLSLNDETVIERVQIVATNHNLSVHDIVVHTERGRKYVSFDLEVGDNLTIAKAHEAASHLEEAIKSEVGADLEISTHIEPLKSAIVSGKPIAQKEEEKIKKIIMSIVNKLKPVRDIHNIQISKIDDKFFISIHCLFDKQTKIEEVHTIASRLEYLIKNELPNTLRVVVHTEPFSP